MSQDVREVNFIRHRRERDQKRESLEWARLAHNIAQEDARTPPNVEIATMIPVTHQGDWKGLDNMATLRKLMELKKRR